MSWQPNKEEKELCEAFLELKTPQEIANFLRDLLTLGEIKEFAIRWQIAKLLNEKKLSYKQIAIKAKTSTATVTRVAQWLNHGENGYQLVLNRLKGSH